MSKLISAALVAAMIITTPAKAEPAKTRCQGAFAMEFMLMLSSAAALYYICKSVWLKERVEKLERQLEIEKAMNSNCKL